MAKYAFADLHGRLDLFNEIINFIKPEDELYFLGDAGDRGPQSWETIKAVYNHPQITFLKGNHEDLLLRAVHITADDFDVRNLIQNGGLNTYMDFMDDPDREKWFFKLNNLPYLAQIENAEGKEIILSHAGFTPLVADEFVLDRNDLMWDRSHFNDKFPIEQYPDLYIIHGHTCPIFIQEDMDKFNGKEHVDMEMEEKIMWYADGHKATVDCGSCWSDYIILLNLDTFEEIKFTVDSNANENV